MKITETLNQIIFTPSSFCRDPKEEAAFSHRGEERSQPHPQWTLWNRFRCDVSAGVLLQRQTSRRRKRRAERSRREHQGEDGGRGLVRIRVSVNESDHLWWWKALLDAISNQKEACFSLPVIVSIECRRPHFEFNLLSQSNHSLSVIVVFIACGPSHFHLTILNVNVKPKEDSTQNVIVTRGRKGPHTALLGFNTHRKFTLPKQHERLINNMRDWLLKLVHPLIYIWYWCYTHCSVCKQINISLWTKLITSKQGLWSFPHFKLQRPKMKKMKA